MVVKVSLVFCVSLAVWKFSSLLEFIPRHSDLSLHYLSEVEQMKLVNLFKAVFIC